MEWSRSETIALSRVQCAYCEGTGLHALRGGKQEPCNCVLRAIFRCCLKRFTECAGKDIGLSRISREQGATLSRTGGWGRKEEEYVADFCLIAKRELTETEYRIFSSHYLLGGDYRICCRQLRMERGVFFHMIYRIQRKLGRAFRETEPYPLFPMSDYFAGPPRAHAAIVSTPAPLPPVVAIRRSLKVSA
jgi:hypothetical protein